MKAEVIVSRMLQSRTAEEYEEYWEELVEWLLGKQIESCRTVSESPILNLQRSFDEVERMEKHLHADKQQGVSKSNNHFDTSIIQNSLTLSSNSEIKGISKIILIVKYLQIYPPLPLLI